MTTQEDPRGYTNVAGFLVPVKYAAWAELLAINMLVPNSSFLGHLAGIVAGLIYTKTIIGRLVDNIIRNITGKFSFFSTSNFGLNYYSRTSIYQIDF